jgi:hypothetical protein
MDVQSGTELAAVNADSAAAGLATKLMTAMCCWNLAPES